jgi:3',5'-cyclic AMP phosphodiesterase CpdA
MSVLLNRAKVFARCLALLLGQIGQANAAEVVDFRSFTVQNHPPPSGFEVPNWSISADGLSASETTNSYSTLLVSPTPIIDKTIRGFITPGSDDDPIGLAIGYQSGDANNASADYLLITWKGATQTFDYAGGTSAASPGGTCPVGLAISRVRGVPNHDELWQHADLAGTSGGLIPLSRAATLGSTAYNRSGGSHYFKIEYTSTGVRVFVDSVLQFDIDGTFAPARWCLWEMSQSPGATYSQFTVSALDEPEPGTVTLPDLGNTPNPPPNPNPANPYGLRAYVWEHVDLTTGRAGAGELLRRAGFHVLPMPLDRPPFVAGSPAADDVDLIFIGSFVADSPAYTTYMSRYGSALIEFMDRGGMIMEMAQRSSLESRPLFLPAAQEATRGANNFSAARVLAPGNQMMNGIPVTGNPVVVSYGLPGNDPNLIFNAFDSFAGFEVILAGDAIARSPALMEGSYGQGRFFLAAMTFDKVFNAKTGSEVAPPSLAAFNQPFFRNLYEHCRNVRDGTIAPITVTPPPGETALADGAWSIVVLPDTQIYAQNYPGIFFAQTSWILDNLRKRNIRFVIGLGDITNVNSIPEWKVARSAYDIIHGRVPYALVPGNHDYGPGGNASTRDTYLNDYLPYSRYAGTPSFGGSKDAGTVENTYHLFEAGGVKWIVLGLEWGPRDSTIQWVHSVLDLYPDRKAILVSHAIMNNNDLRYNIADTVNPQDYNPHFYSTPGPVNDGEELWQKLTRRRNFVMTISGHVLGDGTGFRTDNNDAGQPVAQMLVNYQFRALGGEGYLRILEFQPNGHTVRVSSYSPIYNRFLLTTDQNFQFELPLGAPDADQDGILDYYDDSFDDDGDGLNNYVETVVTGTNTTRVDSDGDGIPDKTEASGGTNPLFNDRPTLQLVAAAPQQFGLYDESMIRELYPGDIVIGLEGGQFRLSLQLEGSATLAPGTWAPLGGPLEWRVPPPDANTYFYRVRATK